MKTSHSGSGRSARWRPGSTRAATSPSSPARRPSARCGRPSQGLGDLIDDYEFHYPQELSRDNLDDVRGALDGHGIYCLASGLHLDPRFAKGGFSLARRRDAAEALG